MYGIYYLYSPDYEIHVVYTKQDSAKKFATLKRNAKNGMVGRMYDYLRKVNYETYLDICTNRDIVSYTPELETAKKLRIEHIRYLRNKYFAESYKEIEDIKEDSENLEDSKKDNNDEVCLLIQKSIEDNNKKIEDLVVRQNVIIS